MRLPKGSYLKLTVPPEPGSATLVNRFSKSQVNVVVPEDVTSVAVLPLLSLFQGVVGFVRGFTGCVASLCVGAAARRDSANGISAALDHNSVRRGNLFWDTVSCLSARKESRRSARIHPRIQRGPTKRQDREVNGDPGH